MGVELSPQGLFVQIQALALPLMSAFQSDLEHDRAWLLSHPDTSFVHVTRASGTHIFELPQTKLLVHDHPRPHLFSVARPSEIYRQVLGLLEHELRAAALLCLVFDGERLRQRRIDEAIKTYTDVRDRALRAAQRQRRLVAMA